MKREEQTRWRPLNLLIVDRDDITVLVHRKAAESTGLFGSIRSATNGLSAFDLVAKAAEGTIPFPDVILLDLDLPILNGITLLKVLQRSDIAGKENIVFVVAASSVSDAEKEVATSLGVSAFLTKPISEESLSDSISSIFTYTRKAQMME